MVSYFALVIAHEPMQNISFNVLVCTMYLMECVCTRAYFENKWHWIQLRVHIVNHAYQSMILLIENWLLPTIQTSITMVFGTGCPTYLWPFLKGYNFFHNWLRTKILDGECDLWADILKNGKKIFENFWKNC